MNDLNPVFEPVESDSLSLPANAEALLRVISESVRNTIVSDSDRSVVFDHLSRVNAKQLLDAGGWNSEEGLGEFLKRHLGCDDAFDSVKFCILQFIHSYCEILQYASQPGVTVEQWGWQVEALYREYVGLLVGAPVSDIEDPEDE